MLTIGYIIVKTVRIVLSVLDIAMFLRAILSWIMPMEDNKFSELLYAITEPFIIPVRKLLEKFNIGQGIPIDISFLVTFLIISILRTVL